MPQPTDGARSTSLGALARRVTAAAGYVMTGRGLINDPGRPLDLIGSQPKGTAFNFPYGVNTNLTPRHNEPVNFETLRQLADVYDLMRLVIETRKDQISALEWTIKPRDEEQQEDARSKAIRTFFERPDQENAWDEWLRMLLEDVLVIDAPAIYVRRTNGGGLYALEQVDGTSIKRLIDARGRTPLPPDPAYQQIIKGVPVANYTAEEMIYRPRNRRVHKVYGFGPVEQILMTVNIGLRREKSQLDYFTEGSVPDALAAVPKEWSAEQIRTFQDYWDALLTGNTATRRKLRFIPDGTRFEQTKEPPLKDMFDEWLARVVCFCFGMDPNAFIQQLNRATAQTAREQTKDEGIAPYMRWVKNLVDSVLAREFNAPDLQFAWVLKDDTRPEVRADMHVKYKQAGVLTVNEIRDELGKDPIEGGDRSQDEINAQAAANAKPDPNAKGGDKTAPPEDRGKGVGLFLAKGGGLGKTGARLASIRRERAALSKILAEFFDREADRVAIALTEPIAKAPIDADRVGQLVLDWEELVDRVAPHLEVIAVESGRAMLRAAAIGMPAEADERMLRERAINWALDRAAEMVGMRRVEDRLIPNPDARWQITESTREQLSQLVSRALEEGWSSAKLARQVRGSTTFSKARASTIARTEIGLADGAGAQLGAVEVGAQWKRWQTSEDDKVSEQCVADGDAGRIAIEEAFPSGSQHPPGHPNCRCNLVYYFTKDEPE